jgi:hypothetical protein
MPSYREHDTVYDEDAARQALEQRRAARQKRQRIRRRQLLLRRALFLLSLVLIAAMAVVIVRHGKHAPADNTDNIDNTANTDNTLPEEDDPYPAPVSPLDADGDGIDDYRDIMLGARAYIATNPVYDANGYFAGGYPDNGTGVCTDVIWAAFQAAGYDLKALVDADIQANRGRYDNITTVDSNIDFRRVSTLDRFFAAHATVLTCDFDDPAQWQPGDIVVFGDRDHIAICSDRRSIVGDLPYIIHHGTLEEGPVEVDAIRRHPVCGHYRWDGGTP